MPLRRAEALCLGLARVLAGVGLITLIGFAAATLLDGLSRSVADRPITAVGDVGAFAVAAAVSACFPLAQLQRANISIDLVGLAAGERAARYARAFASVVVAVVMAAMARQMVLYAADSASGGDATVMLGIPTAPFWYAAAAMLVCAAITQVLVATIECGRCASPPHATGGG